MDSRYPTKRFSENSGRDLHQRHKSTGNLLANKDPQGLIAGIRGPAKRAAFSDVINLAKDDGGVRDDRKITKMQSMVHVRGGVQAHTLANKENVLNVSGKGETLALARPAQRLSVLGAKSKNVIDNRSRDRVKKADRPLIRTQSSQNQGLDNASLPYQANSAAQPIEHIVPQPAPVHESSTSLHPQPRHHKSQPQLKQQQPTLRRTQSRHLERAEVPYERASVLHTESDLHGAPLLEDPAEEPDVDLEYFDPPEVPLSADDFEEAEINEPEFVEMPSRLPEISEEPAFQPHNFKDGPTTGLSEPEEDWDGEDYDYDDQDQAFTTAHSVRSRDMTTIIQPQATARVERELEEARQEVLATLTYEDIEEEEWDISMVKEYSEEIFVYMRELENKMLPNPHYMDIQTEIQWSMRSVLMDWLVQVHKRFNLLPETLFLTVNYIDRFLSNKVVSIGKLQLVGATAMLVASKYEEINCPSLQEIVYMVDGGYTTDEITKAERFMLSMLNFELGWPGPMSFLRRVSKADDYDLDTRTLAKYFLELTIMDERFVATPPSFSAAGAHCLSRLILGKGDWSKRHVHYSGYTWSQLRPLVAMMLECCEQPHRHHSAIFEKYAERRFKEASTIVQEALEGGFRLPSYTLPARPDRKSYNEREYSAQFEQYSEENYVNLSHGEDGGHSSKALLIPV